MEVTVQCQADGCGSLLEVTVPEGLDSSKPVVVSCGKCNNLLEVCLPKASTQQRPSELHLHTHPDHNAPHPPQPSPQRSNVAWSPSECDHLQHAAHPSNSSEAAVTRQDAGGQCCDLMQPSSDGASQIQTHIAAGDSLVEAGQMEEMVRTQSCEIDLNIPDLFNLNGLEDDSLGGAVLPRLPSIQFTVARPADPSSTAFADGGLHGKPVSLNNQVAYASTSTGEAWPDSTPTASHQAASPYHPRSMAQHGLPLSMQQRQQQQHMMHIQYMRQLHMQQLQMRHMQLAGMPYGSVPFGGSAQSQLHMAAGYLNSQASNDSKQPNPFTVRKPSKARKGPPPPKTLSLLSLMTEDTNEPPCPSSTEANDRVQYTCFISQEVKRVRAQNPRMSHEKVLQTASQNWSNSRATSAPPPSMPSGLEKAQMAYLAHPSASAPDTRMGEGAHCTAPSSTPGSTECANTLVLPDLGTLASYLRSSLIPALSAPPSVAAVTLFGKSSPEPESHLRPRKQGGVDLGQGGQASAGIGVFDAKMEAAAYAAAEAAAAAIREEQQQAKKRKEEQQREQGEGQKARQEEEQVRDREQKEKREEEEEEEEERVKEREHKEHKQHEQEQQKKEQVKETRKQADVAEWETKKEQQSKGGGVVAQAGAAKDGQGDQKCQQQQPPSTEEAQALELQLQMLMLLAQQQQQQQQQQPPMKKRRGRPRKYPLPSGPAVYMQPSPTPINIGVFLNALSVSMGIPAPDAGQSADAANETAQPHADSSEAQATAQVGTPQSPQGVAQPGVARDQGQEGAENSSKTYTNAHAAPSQVVALPQYFSVNDDAAAPEAEAPSSPQTSLALDALRILGKQPVMHIG